MCVAAPRALPSPACCALYAAPPPPFFSPSQLFYACTETPAARAALLARLDAARRRKIVGDDGKELVKVGSGVPTAAAAGAGEGAFRLYTWGVGVMLGRGSEQAQAWGLPHAVPVA